MNDNVPLIYKILIALASGAFSLAVAISVQHIRIYKVPKWIIILAIIVQLVLSWGVFIFVMLFFKSGLLPDEIPNDDWSALVCAYGASTIPHIVITTLIFIYNKEVNKWLESRYGEGMHDMDSLEARVMMKDNICPHCQKATDSTKHTEIIEKNTQKLTSHNDEKG